MSIDPTENTRRLLVAVVNLVPGSREDLESRYGKVWDTAQLTADFEAIGFAAPFILVRRSSDGVEGTLMFQHSPRFYRGFSPA